jgi:hypothetical protein
MKSNLTEKLLSICGNSIEVFGINNLTEEQRSQIETELIKHFEFDKILWMQLPSGLSEDKTTPIVAKSIRLSDSDNPTYKHKVGYIYTISFTPKIYAPGDMHKPVKDGCVFAPITYNPETFEPTQNITLTWSPDFPQDINAPARTFEDDKQMIRDLLEKVLSNPEEYRPEGFTGGLLRYVAL